MIPNTVLGLAFFAASLGPGYVYTRESGRGAPRPDQSHLAEAVEMLVIGAVASVLSAMVVLTVGSASGALDEQALAHHAARYLVTEPVRGLGSVSLLFLLSYGASWLAARAIHRKTEPIVKPGGSGWLDAFWVNRPRTKPTVPLVLVELRDGRKVVGVVKSFTAQLEDNRELLLVAPMASQPNAISNMTKIDDDFLLLREQDILYIAGRYSGVRDSQTDELAPALSRADENQEEVRDGSG